MSVTLDPAVNALISQSMSMQSQQVDAAIQIKAIKGAQEMQENVVMTLISSVGLSTYDQNAQMQSVAGVGQVINIQA
jgi:hypothetical protein